MASHWQATHRQRAWLYVLGGAIMMFLLLPTLLVVPMSFSDSSFLGFPPPGWSTRWYEHYWNSTEWTSATWVSLRVALVTVLVATPLGTLAAYGLHMSRGPLATAIFFALATPLVVPVIFIAIGVFYLYSRLNLLYTTTGLVIAHSTLALPFVMALVASGLKSFDENQEKAARSLGAPRWRAFLTITLPQIRFSVISAALLAFLTSFDEVIIALLISGGLNETLTRRMFTTLRDQIDPTIAAISTILIGISIGCVLLSQALQAKSDERG
ncbi:ABC transporter permease [Rhodoligotrophos defluvii]|uniref:ABC transporter permease n=1 Tax=Rhodoligotrophos defluvii TaxID=2561934 RepID=UPI0010C9D2E4|nr:ABC transporter permease [Rhodoligotrophos defluvii]